MTLKNQTTASRSLRRILPKMAVDGVLPFGTASYMAKRYGVSRQAVGQKIKKLGLKCERNNEAAWAAAKEEREQRIAYARLLRSNSRKARVIRASTMWASGASIDDIGRDLGLTGKAAYQFINKARKTDLSLFPYRHTVNKSRLNVPIKKRGRASAQAQPVA